MDGSVEIFFESLIILDCIVSFKGRFGKILFELFDFLVERKLNESFILNFFL